MNQSSVPRTAHPLLKNLKCRIWFEWENTCVNLKLFQKSIKEVVKMYRL